jgi:hypothetical protein
VPTFTVLAHEQPLLLRRLVDRLAPHPVVVHVDRKADQRVFERALSGCDTVTFVAEPARVAVHWAGFSMVRAMAAVFAVAVDQTSDDDYVVMCSGSDYLLRPVEELTAHLHSSPGRQHIRYFDIETSVEHYRRQVRRRHFRDAWVVRSVRGGAPGERVNNAVRRGLSAAAAPLPDRRPPEGLRLAFGSTWFALTAACLRSVLEQRTPAIDRYFARTFAPDEKYFHSLVASSGFHDMTPARGFEPFGGVGTYRLANLHHIDPSLDKWFTLEDWPELGTSPAWFVRKVRLPASGALLDHIDRVRLHR